MLLKTTGSNTMHREVLLIRWLYDPDVKFIKKIHCHNCLERVPLGPEATRNMDMLQKRTVFQARQHHTVKILDEFSLGCLSCNSQSYKPVIPCCIQRCNYALQNKVPS